MQTCEFAGNRITRWLLSIQDFDLEIQHIAGKKNTVADMLSRHSETEQSNQNQPGDIVVESVLARETRRNKHDNR